MSEFSFYEPETSSDGTIGTQNPSNTQPDGGTNTPSASQNNNTPTENTTTPPTQDGGTTQTTQQEDQQQEESNKTVQEGMLVCNGALCQCTFGTAPVQLLVTSNTKYYVNDPQGAQKMVATMKDNKVANLNFGVCKNGASPPPPCAANLTWTQEHTTIKLKIQGAETSALSENSRATCAVGGQVSILKNGQTPVVTEGNIDKISVAAPAVNCMVDMQELKELTKPKELRPVGVTSLKSGNSKSVSGKTPQTGKPGTVKVRLNDEVLFEVEKYGKNNPAPTEEEKQQIDWSVFQNGKLLYAFGNKGAKLSIKFDEYGTYIVEASGKEKSKNDDGTVTNDLGASIEVEVIKNELTKISVIGSNQRYGTVKDIDTHNIVRLGAPVTFKAEFSIPSNAEETSQTNWRLLDSNEGEKQTMKGVSEFIATEMKNNTVYTIEVTSPCGNQTIDVYAQSNGVRKISGTVNGKEREVIRPEEAIAFKVTEGEYDGEITEKEAGTINWVHYKNGAQTTEKFEPGKNLSESKYETGKHVVEAYVRKANAFLGGRKNELDDWEFMVEKNSVSNIKGDFNPKLGKFYSYSLDFVMPVNQNEISDIVWEITGPENHTYYKCATLTIRFNHKGPYKLSAYLKEQPRTKIIKDINVRQCEIISGYWTDADINIIAKSGYGKLDNDKKIVKGQVVYIYFKHVALEGETVIIQVWDNDYSANKVYESPIFKVPEEAREELKYELTFTNQIKDAIEKFGIFNYGSLYFMVLPQSISALNSKNAFPSDKSKYLYVSTDEKIINAYFADKDDRKKILRADYTDKVNIQIYSANLVDRDLEVFLIEYKTISRWWALAYPIFLNDEIRDYLKKDKQLKKGSVKIDKEGQAKFDIGLSGLKDSHEGEANKVRELYAVITYGKYAYVVQPFLKVTKELASSEKSKKGVGFATVELLEGVKKKEKCQNCKKPFTIEQIEQIFGKNDGSKNFRQEIVNTLNKYIKQKKDENEPLHIDTCLRKAHFLAQVGTETLGLDKNWFVETDVYKYKLSSFKSAWPELVSGLTDDKITNYCSNQARVLNYVYGTKKASGLGNNIVPTDKLDDTNQDGYKFRGRGLIQLTGRYNYKKATEYLKKIFPNDYIDLEENPDKVGEVKYAVLSAIAYWENGMIFMTADNAKSKNEVKTVRVKVNSGLKGLKECVEYFENAFSVFDVGNCPVSFAKKKSEELTEYEVEIIFQSHLSKDRVDIVSQKSLNCLKKAGKLSGNKKIVIASTIRTPEEQASAMYGNLINGSDLNYGAAGEKVEKIYYDRKSTKTKEQILNEMTNKIKEYQKQKIKVSNHCVSKEMYNELNVIDISYKNGNIINPTEFIKNLANDVNVQKIIHPFTGVNDTTGKLKLDDKEPAIHVQINQ